MNTQVRVTTPPLSPAHRCCYREDGRPKQCWSQPRAERIAAQINRQMDVEVYPYSGEWEQDEPVHSYFCPVHECHHVGRARQENR